MRRLLAITLLLAACMSQTPPPSPSATSVGTETPRPTKTAAPARTSTVRPTEPPNVHAIPGLTNADIKLNLQDRGFDCSGPELTGDTATWSCTRTSGLADLTVRYWGPSPTVVEGVDAQSIFADDQLAAEFLGFIATLPYDGADPVAARDWVQARIGQAKSTTIGGARFTLGGPENARYLTIQPK